jgi:hypothetical protein
MRSVKGALKGVLKVYHAVVRLGHRKAQKGGTKETPNQTLFSIIPSQPFTAQRSTSVHSLRQDPCQSI